jgi:hypothetical protein
VGWEAVRCGTGVYEDAPVSILETFTEMECVLKHYRLTIGMLGLQVSSGDSC